MLCGVKKTHPSNGRSSRPGATSKPSFHGGWHPKSRFITVGDSHVHYVDLGEASEDPPILFINGFVMRSWSWRLNLEALATQHRVIAVCLPGFGFSDKPKLSYTLESYSQFMEEFLRKMQISRAHFVGHSMGGAIALLVALERPSLVGRLVLLASAGVRWNKAAWVSSVPLFLARLFSPVVFRRQVFRQLLRRLGYYRPVVSEIYLDTFMRILKSPGASYSALKVGMELPAGLERLYPRLSHVKHRPLLIWGRHDRVVPVRAGERIHELIEGSQLEIIEDCGHCPNEEAAEELNQLLLEYFQAAN